MKALLLCLCLGCARMSPRYPAHLGTLVRTVQTDAGPMAVYRDALGCSLTLRGVIVDHVSLVTCNA